MSYAARQQNGSSRLVAIVIVALVHMLLAYAFVTGLAYTVIQKAAVNLKTFDVEEAPPPPPEEPPPPPPETVQESPPPVVSPPPIVRTKIPPPPVVRTVSQAPPPVVTNIAPIAPPAPPAPPPPPPAPPPPPPPAPPPVKTVPPRSAVGNLQGLFRGSDYPEAAIERDEQGAVTVSLTIDTKGRVDGCDVTRSSGSHALDCTTCRILERRARFMPARNSHGNPTVDTVRQNIKWVLEG